MRRYPNMLHKRVHDKPGFLSNKEWFEEKEVDECQAFLGPGYYDSKSFVDLTLNNDKPTSTIPLRTVKHKDYLGSAPWFNYNEKVIDTPGPGAYELAHQTFIKKSSNLYFSD